MMHEKQNRGDESLSFRGSLLSLPERILYVAAWLLAELRRRKRKKSVKWEKNGKSESVG